ncbi:MAG: LacI family DNA-binding transcriptional regulator [Acidimicrobiales bacterium]
MWETHPSSWEAADVTVDIRQVAAAAGVSTATVSRVLSGRGPASAEARRKVHSAARRLHYLPNASASSLRTDRSMIIGVLVPNLGNPVYLPFLRAVEQTTQAYGYSVIVADTGRSPETERHQLDRLAAQRTDALIMAGRPANPEHIRRLGRSGLPVVDPITLGSELGQDAAGAGREAVIEACRHIASLEHQALAFVVRGTALQQTSRWRWDLIRATCELLGIETSLVTLGNVPWPDVAGAPTMAGTLAELLEGTSRRSQVLDGTSRRPTVLWSSSHVLAPQLLESLATIGMDLPSDCSFLTFGDSPWASAYRPPISVVTGDLAAVAILMTRTVLHRLGVIRDAPDPNLPPDSYRPRRSVGPAPGS